MRRVIFTYEKGWNNTIKEVVEYAYDITDEKIQKDFEEWIWNIIGDNCSWYEE